MPKTVGKSPKASPASKAKPIRKRAKAASLGIAYPNACGIDIQARQKILHRAVTVLL